MYRARYETTDRASPKGGKADTELKNNDYLSSCEGSDFIIKHAIGSYEGDFEYPQKLQAGLAECPNLRTMVDIVSSLRLYVYPFMTGDLLQLSQKPLSEEQRRYILGSALTGLAALHDRGIFHTGEHLHSRVGPQIFPTGTERLT